MKLLVAVAIAATIALPGVAVGADRSPRAAVADAKREWLRELRLSARGTGQMKSFPSPPRTVLLRRLRAAQAHFRFRIVSVRLLKPVQFAPAIVIASDRRRSLAKAVPNIVNAFDPRHVTAENPSGYAYEAYFLEVRDTRGTPYIATFNFWRGPHVGGGEWAAAESLYPFPHG